MSVLSRFYFYDHHFGLDYECPIQAVRQSP